MSRAWPSYRNLVSENGNDLELGKAPTPKQQRQYEYQVSGGSYQALGQQQGRQNAGSGAHRLGANPENQELLSSNPGREYWRGSLYSDASNLADTGPSPRTSTSSQAVSSRPILQTPSPESSLNHSYAPAVRDPSGQRLSTGNPRARHIPTLGEMDYHSTSTLNPPSAPFAQDSTPSSRTGSPGPGDDSIRYSTGSNIPILGASISSRTIPRNVSYDAGGLTSAPSSASLSVNYLPSKFSTGLVNAEARESSARRRRGGGVKGGRGMEMEMDGVRIPKMGGGRDAFRAEESRMAGERDEDEDEEFRTESRNDRRPLFSFLKKSAATEKVTIAPLPKKTMRWNRFKWTLFVCNSLLTAYSVVCLVICLLTWFDAWSQADIIRVGNTRELILSTVASVIGLFTSLVGWAGLLMNNRMFLAIYTFLCWITFIFLIVPGYLTYKKRTFNLEGKINAQWSQALGAEGRLRIQDQLRCCGYFSPFVEATISQTCYARSILPGCKRDYIDFEDDILKRWYIVVFSLVPVHIMVMTAGLLCSNHVTYRFGKGMMPKAYRLSLTSMAVIMDQYAQQLADQYGTDIASEVMTRSKSHTQLAHVPQLPYADSTVSSAGNSMDKIPPPAF